MFHHVLPRRSRQAHAADVLSCLLTLHFLTPRQSTAWHPDEVLRYTLMKHGMGTREKTVRFSPKHLCFPSENTTFCILTMDTLPLKQAEGGQSDKKKGFPFSAFTVSRACKRLSTSEIV
ncbi:hypothetical protein [uncultured Bacteroides sp.]|uniref:hypothetical protein n=1 Tax=uncultured Bacteroides sp. TaxID=162156 RepID=UPI00262FC121|nr:hypothetical protein [uncultured Bacteroides sp.]